MEFRPGGPSPDIDFVEKKNGWGENFFFGETRTNRQAKKNFLVRTSQRHLSLAPLLSYIIISNGLHTKSYFKWMLLQYETNVYYW